MDKMKNVDAVVADGFGREWSAFDQSSLATEEHLQLFNQYFSIFPVGRIAAGRHGNRHWLRKWMLGRAGRG